MKAAKDERLIVSVINRIELAESPVVALPAVPENSEKRIRVEVN